MCYEGRLVRLDGSGHRGQDAFCSIGVVYVDQGAQKRPARAAKQEPQRTAQRRPTSAPRSRRSFRRLSPGPGACREVVGVAFFYPKGAVFHLHDGHRMQIDAPLCACLLQDGCRLVGSALPRRSRVRILYSHNPTPFLCAPSLEMSCLDNCSVLIKTALELPSRYPPLLKRHPSFEPDWPDQLHDPEHDREDAEDPHQRDQALGQMASSTPKITDVSPPTIIAQSPSITLRNLRA